MKRISSILHRVRVARRRAHQVRVLKRLRPNNRAIALVTLQREGFNYVKVDQDNFILYFEAKLPLVCIKRLESACNARWMIYTGGVGADDFSRLSLKFNRHRKFEKYLKEAFDMGASDIFVTLHEDFATVRFRQRRYMTPGHRINREEGDALLKSLLALAQLNFDDTLRNQEGHFRYELDENMIFCRLSYMASPVSQSLVLRLLSEDLFPFRLNNLQLPDNLMEYLKTTLPSLRSGMILVSGPTGSGKTTTLYSIAKMLRAQGKKIISIEDPVEAELNELLQTEVNPEFNYTFEEALKSVFRQDPDLVIIGEVRDEETAKVAFNACLSGLLVMTTLHAQNVSDIVLRCSELGIDFSRYVNHVRLQIHQEWELGDTSDSPKFRWKARERSSRSL